MREPRRPTSVRLIKIDVEGAELPILEQTLATVDCYPRDADIIVEFSPSGAADEWIRVFDQFLSAGFAAFGIGNDHEVTAYLRWRAPCELQRTEWAVRVPHGGLAAPRLNYRRACPPDR